MEFFNKFKDWVNGQTGFGQFVICVCMGAILIGCIGGPVIAMLLWNPIMLLWIAGAMLTLVACALIGYIILG